MTPLTETETIAAIATPPGAGGIGIIRASGPLAFSLLNQLFLPHQPHTSFISHKLYYGKALARNGEILDQILAVYMRAPRSYTGEDVVEFHCHGAPFVLHELLEHLFDLGARPAQRGEFTKRAFLAGRIDLTQAEAVIDLLEAQTARSASMAVYQLEGVLAQEVAAIRDALVDLLALLEVAIDFPDDDVEIFDRRAALHSLRYKAMTPITALIKAASHGMLHREGMRAVLAGRPNAGKSSLLNALLGTERAIVNAQPGTTRDTLEELIDLEGIPLRLVDTAGIRDHQDPVEAMGIKRTQQMIAQADIVLVLVDCSVGLLEEDQKLLTSLTHTKHLGVLSKCDLLEEEALASLEALLQRIPGQRQWVRIAAKQNEGLDALRQALIQLIRGDQEQPFTETSRLAPNRRHRNILTQVLEVCRTCEQAIVQGASVDLLAVEFQAALDKLGEISGRVSTEDVLDALFSRFCIGK